ncbi:hypothetical protein K504DRAFT_430539 [Pleomassaria siparia CBS 279.74]|uniref:Zn(2)-C6 fungal-type domain-containing protein n=1 Tax=Pleomassaria siparia CBS 279.74 TaxID=1314801 RepID=A0A6G1KCD2_9PLEO|nr:hypothetical protein K504DRAFT_430539 [Pleomassaria siparia CBS 279.74]
MESGLAGTCSDQPARKQQEQSLNRACEACRLSKVRCLMNPDLMSPICQRCAKAGKLCIFAAPAKRRQRKRTDVRVAELEKAVRQMRSLLRSNRISPVEISDHEPTDEETEERDERQERESPVADHGRLEGSSTSTTASASAPVPEDKSPNTEKQPDKIPSYNQNTCGPKDSLGDFELDIIDRGLISHELAEELLDIYRNDLVHESPGVVIPSNWTMSQLRHQKPALFHAVMAAAAHCKGEALSNRLSEEVVFLYARSLFVKGEKSLQYVQALLVTVAYYSPPSSPAHLQIYRYTTMAASMALELGLAYKPRTHEELPKRAIRTLHRISSPDELLENCRTILVLYALAAGFSMRLRKPNILSYNSWMEECLSLLQKSPKLDDKRVVAWVQLQRIADEANTAFGFDDASTSFSLSELRLQVILRLFEKRMEDWKKSVPRGVLSLSLMIEYHQNILGMWEFGMDGGRYNAPDFSNRHLTLPALDDDCVQPESLLSCSGFQINATIKCIGAAHSLLDTFEQFSTEQLQKASSILFVRSIYALVALMKADYGVGTDAEGLGLVLDSQSLKVDYYLDTISKKVSDAIGTQKCRVPSHWYFVLNQKLVAWREDFLQWRKEGKYPKRKDPSGESEDSMTDAPGTALGAEVSQDDPLPTPASESIPTVEQQMSQVPNFGIGNAFAPWHSTGLALLDPDLAQAPGDPQTAFPSDMGDFSEAFQNGDLYLWNDLSENFGGYIPQGGSIYSDLQFGALNNDQQL